MIVQSTATLKQFNKFSSSLNIPVTVHRHHRLRKHQHDPDKRDEYPTLPWDKKDEYLG